MDFSNKAGNNNIPLSDEVLEILESQFNKVKTLHSTDLEIIAAELGVRDNDVKVISIYHIKCNNLTTYFSNINNLLNNLINYNVALK